MARIVLINNVITASVVPVGSVGVALPTLAWPVTHGLLTLRATTTNGQAGVVTARLWIRPTADTGGYWYPAGNHATPDTKGVLNKGEVIGETATDLIQHAEEIGSLSRVTEVYLQILAPANLVTLYAWLDCFTVR